jgi:hypothetical protein
MRKRLFYDEDPMMEMVCWAVIILLGIGFLFGFGVGIGVAFFVP